MTTLFSRLALISLAGLAASLGACTIDQVGDATAGDEHTQAKAAPTPASIDPMAISTGAAVTGLTNTTQGGNASATIESSVVAHANDSRDGAPGEGDSGNISQISFAPEGADFDPDVSRDGRTIVFASTQHRPKADIYIKSTTGRTVTQLTNDPANDLMPRLSPDGTRIAFASDRAGNWDIYVMPATGGKPIQVTSSAAQELHPSWSPDGSEIAYCRLGETSGLWEMWITSVSNPGIARFVGNGLFPQWCPISGTGSGGADRIAFQKSRERGDRAFGIWVMDYRNGEAGNTTEIASSTISACINPSWSPDGQWIAYATVPNPSEWSGESRPSWAELWMVDAAGNNRVALTGGHFVNLMPSWGPQNKLYFVSDRGGIDNIWSMDTAKVLALAASNAATPAIATATPKRAAAPTAAPIVVPSKSAQPPIATVPETTEHH